MGAGRECCCPCRMWRGVGQWPHERGRVSARLSFTEEGVRAPDLFSRFWSTLHRGRGKGTRLIQPLLEHYFGTHVLCARMWRGVGQWPHEGGRISARLILLFALQ